MKTRRRPVNVVRRGRVAPPSPVDRFAQDRIAVSIFAVVFVAILIAISIFFPTPTPFQYLVFRIALAVAAGGVAGFLPGMIYVEIKSSIRVTGALAVFVITYFFSPVGLSSP